MARHFPFFVASSNCQILISDAFFTCRTMGRSVATPARCAGAAAQSKQLMLSATSCLYHQSSQLLDSIPSFAFSFLSFSVLFPRLLGLVLQWHGQSRTCALMALLRARIDLRDGEKKIEIHAVLGYWPCTGTDLCTTNPSKEVTYSFIVMVSNDKT